MTLLIEASDADFLALLAGRPAQGHHVVKGGIESNEVLQILRSLAASVRQDFSPVAWLIVDRNHIVGMCSLLTAPTTKGSVPIGYGIAPAYRGKGIGKRAIAALAKWACSHPQITSIEAETAIGNGPSQGILLQNNFIKCGDRHDLEDGDLFCWRLDTL